MHLIGWSTQQSLHLIGRSGSGALYFYCPDSWSPKPLKAFRLTTSVPRFTESPLFVFFFFFHHNNAVRVSVDFLISIACHVLTFFTVPHCTNRDSFFLSSIKKSISGLIFIYILSMLKYEGKGFLRDGGFWSLIVQYPMKCCPTIMPEDMTTLSH